ncbi:unnamed protein product [Durusdinium trenchii]|uniref:Uncharacterized protein n=1 Tax=Durusdinium trenchii TaxID=1381693 RepID=A0ABP0I0E2_9DINO
MLLTQLALRLRTAQGSILQAGDLLRLYMWPLTSWDLKVCEAQCVPQSPAMSCVEPTCHAESLFSTPFKGGGNVLEFVLPDGMEPITNHVMHTIVLRGPHFRLPPGGFMPTRLAGELFSTDRERRVSYAESVGLLPFVPVKVVGGVLQPTGSEPFADDAWNPVSRTKN